MCDQARVRGSFDDFESLLKVADGGTGLALHQIDAGEEVVGLGVVALGIGEDGLRDGSGAVQVALEQLHLGQFQAGELAGCAA